MPQPSYAFVFGEEQAEILNAALSRYLTHLKEHEDPEIRAIIPHVEQLQRMIVDEVRTPTIPYIDVKTLGMLSQMNHAKQVSSGPQAQAAQEMFKVAHSWLTILHSVSVHFSERDGAWHFGRQDGPPSLAQNGPSEAKNEVLKSQPYE